MSPIWPQLFSTYNWLQVNLFMAFLDEKGQSNANSQRLVKLFSNEMAARRQSVLFLIRENFPRFFVQRKLNVQWFYFVFLLWVGKILQFCLISLSSYYRLASLLSSPLLLCHSSQETHPFQRENGRLNPDNVVFRGNFNNCHQQSSG
jgi:hypothetical protein